jgi:hypothetical protein
VDEHGATGVTATLDIRHDPGRAMKYVGGALIVGGTIAVFAFGSAERRKERRAKVSRAGERALVPAAV